MPRSTCSPIGTSGVVVSAATAPEINTDRPSGRHSPSSWLTRLTAGPMAVKSSRSTAPILPHRISPRCSAAPEGQRRQPLRLPNRIEMGHAGAGGDDRAQRRLTGLGQRAGDRENRQHGVADELQHLAPEGVHRPGDAIEPGVEGGNHRRGLGRLGQGGEAAQTCGPLPDHQVGRDRRDLSASHLRSPIVTIISSRASQRRLQKLLVRLT